MGGPDDEGAVEAAINRSGERDGSFATNASAAGYAPSRVASGKVRQVRFLDAEVAYWQCATAQLMVSGPGAAPLPRSAGAHALDGTRLLVVVCDHKVVLYDLLSKKPFEVTRAQLDGRAPTCVAFLFRGGPGAPGGAPPLDGVMASPVLAVGCSDGAVRLVHLATLRTVGQLVPVAGRKAAAVTAVVALPSLTGLRGGGDAAAAAAAAAAATNAPSAAAGIPGRQRSKQRMQQQQQQQQQQQHAAAGAAAGGDAFVPPRDLVVAADSVGGLMVWDAFARPLGGRDLAPARSVEGHSGEVWSLCLAPGPEDPALTAPRLFSCAADRHVAAWDPHSLAELWRVKMDAKAPATSLAYSHRYFNLSGAHALLMTVNGSAVAAMYTLAALPPERGVRPCVDLAPLIPPGHKKVPKAYAVAVSPMRPNLAAVGANSGAAFLAFDRMYPLPVAPLPPASLADAHLGPGRDAGEAAAAAGRAAYVAHMGDALWLVTVGAADRDLDGSGVAHTLPVVLGKERIGSAAQQSGRAIVGASPSGAYVSCCWPAGRRYAVFYRTLAGEWQEVDSGLGVDLAWHSHRDQFAVVEEPPPQLLHVPKPRGGGLLKSREKEAAKAAAAAAEAAAAAAARAVVRIRALDGLQVTLTCEQVAVGADVPVGVHGGPLLGVSYKRTTTAGAQLSGEDASPVLQLWSWDGRTKVGPELPEPNFVRWDPTVSVVALGYLRQVTLFRARPSFEPIGAVPLAGATGAAWALRQLFVVTASGVHVAFVSAGESRGAAARALMDLGDGEARGPAEAAVSVVALASTTGSDATSGLRGDAAGAGAALPAPAPRPPGPLALLGARGGNLWLVNSYGQPMVLPLRHPGLRARCLAALGDVVGAAQVAAAGLAPAHHDDFASFLAAAAGPTGAQLALVALHGLSLETEAELCMSTGQWRRALACLDALLHGCADRSHLRLAGGAAAARYAEATEPAAALAESVARAAAAAVASQQEAAAAAAAAAPLAASGPQPGDPPPPSAVATNQAMWSYMGFGGLFVDNFSEPAAPGAGADARRGARDPVARGRVDWGAPLAAGWQFAKGGGDGAGSGKKAKASAAAAAQQQAQAQAQQQAGALAPSPAALRLAMRLVEGSQDAGILDVTTAAAQLLLAHRGSLEPAQLARLAARMAGAGMNADVRLLADSGVASGSHKGQAVGFVAAALTGDLDRLQAALQASGTVALAALQANTYRLPASFAQSQRWNDALKRAAAAGGEQAYLSVVPPGL